MFWTQGWGLQMVRCITFVSTVRSWILISKVSLQAQCLQSWMHLATRSKIVTQSHNLIKWHTTDILRSIMELSSNKQQCLTISFFREIAAASGEWVNEFIPNNGKKKTSSKLYVPSTAELLKRNIKRSWTISSEYIPNVFSLKYWSWMSWEQALSDYPLLAKVQHSCFCSNLGNKEHEVMWVQLLHKSYFLLRLKKWHKIICHSNLIWQYFWWVHTA